MFLSICSTMFILDVYLFFLPMFMELSRSLFVLPTMFILDVYLFFLSRCLPCLCNCLDVNLFFLPCLCNCLGVYLFFLPCLWNYLDFYLFFLPFYVIVWMSICSSYHVYSRCLFVLPTNVYSRCLFVLSTMFILDVYLFFLPCLV